MYIYIYILMVVKSLSEDTLILIKISINLLLYYILYLIPSIICLMFMYILF